MKNSGSGQSGFHKSAALAESFTWLASTASTNDDIAVMARESSAPSFTVVATDRQTAGRGRLGREWIASSGKTLAVSVLVRLGEPAPHPDQLGWLPLMAGEAMARAVRAELADLLTDLDGETRAPLVELKWPNDVLIDGYKVSGILTELLADEQAVVIGSGVNLTLDEHDLPTLTSTSLLLAAHRQPDPDRLLARYLEALRHSVTEWAAHAGDADRAGVLELVRAACGTIGSDVRIELPGSESHIGTALDLDPQGRLIVRLASGDTRHIAAADITHLRLEP